MNAAQSPLILSVRRSEQSKGHAHAIESRLPEKRK